MPSKLQVAEPLYLQVLSVLESARSKHAEAGRLPNYALLAHTELQSALANAIELEKTTPLTNRKNKWLVKNASGEFVLAGAPEARRTAALADVLERYQIALAAAGLYDFDDMILRAIDVLEKQ